MGLDEADENGALLAVGEDEDEGEDESGEDEADDEDEVRSSWKADDGDMPVTNCGAAELVECEMDVE